MRPLANDLGPAKISFLCYPSPSREVTAVLDRLALRPDGCGISNSSRSTLFQGQFVSRAMTLNNRRSDFLAERIKKNASTVRFAAGIYEAVRNAVKLARSLAGFAPRVQAGKSL
jgi:hypothetical protein